MLCGLAPTLDVLAVSRLLQGIAGALLVPGSLAIITALFEGPERGRAFGIWASATSAVAVVGPPIGGALVEAFGWRSIFLLNAPLIALGLVAGDPVRSRAAQGRRSATRFDWVGADRGRRRGRRAGLRRDPRSAGLVERAGTDRGILGIGAVALLAFPILMVRRRDPLVPPALFRSRTFSAINVSTLLIYAALYVLIYMQSLFLQGVLGYSPLAAALTSLPTGLLLAFLSAYAGTLAGRYGARPFLVGGPLLMVLGTPVVAAGSGHLHALAGPPRFARRRCSRRSRSSPIRSRRSSSSASGSPWSWHPSRRRS